MVQLNSEVSDEKLLSLCFPELGQNITGKVTSQYEQLENSRSFWSKIVRIRLNWSSSDLELRYPKSLIAKLPHLTENVLAGAGSAHELQLALADLTEHEIAFYKMLQGDEIPFLPLPRFFYGEGVEGVETGGLLVVEDKSAEAVAADYIPGLSVRQVEVMMDALAGFHSYIIQSPRPFTKVFDRTDTLDDGFQNEQFATACSLEEKSAALFHGQVTPLQSYFTKEHAKEAHYSYKKLGIPPVLVHADLNTTNILWKRSSTPEKPELGVVIDFQQMHTGNICEDIARLMMLAMPKEARRQNTDRMLKRYHSTLTKLFNGTPPYTLEKVRQCYSYIFPYAANFALFGLPIYIDMFEKLESDEVLRKEKQAELLDRALGIVEDMTAYIRQREGS